MFWIALILIGLGLVGLIGWVANDFTNTPLAVGQALLVVAGVAIMVVVT